MLPLFKDPGLQAQLHDKGFVVVDALNESQVADLLAYYHDLNIVDEKGYGFHISMDQQDKALVQQIVDKIHSIVYPAVAPMMADVKVFTASYLIKDPNPKGVVPAHQDWTFVEEEGTFNSLTFWIPLVDVDMDNGALGVIHGSHRFFDHLRPSPSPQVPTPLGKHMFSIFPYLDIVELKAGQAIVFDNRTFHASPPNTTTSSRIAVGLGFTQKNAQFRHYFTKPDGQMNRLLKYKVDEPFFNTYDNARLSKMYDEGKIIEDYELLDELDYHFPEFSSEELTEMIKNAGNQMNPPLIEKLARLFNYNLDGSKKEEAAPVKDLSEEAAAPSPDEEDQASILPEEAEATPVLMTDPTAPIVEEVPVKRDDRPFWKIYTPLNIIREIKYRITKG